MSFAHDHTSSLVAELELPILLTTILDKRSKRNLSCDSKSAFPMSAGVCSQLSHRHLTHSVSTVKLRAAHQYLLTRFQNSLRHRCLFPFPKHSHPNVSFPFSCRPVADPLSPLVYCSQYMWNVLILGFCGEINLIGLMKMKLVKMIRLLGCEGKVCTESTFTGYIFNSDI